MKRTTVWLVRHALPDGGTGRCYGNQDVSLSAGGICQAQEIAKRFTPQSLSQVYSSTLSRAEETARILAEPHGLKVQTIEALREIHFGDLEGLTYEEIEKRYPDVFQFWMQRPTEIQFPNGESYSQMRLRVLAAFDRVLSRHREESIAIVSHAGVIRMLLGEALGLAEHRIFRLGQRYGAINRIDYFDAGPVVELING